jgi:SAM-dependent methyltransferase
MRGDDPKQLVRHGYDALSDRSRADDAGDGRYGPWLAALHARIPAGAAVLDLGCGNGIPVARFLAAAGHAVTGVDCSEVQVRRARRHGPHVVEPRRPGDRSRVAGEAGLRVVAEAFVPEGDGGHALLWARRPEPPRVATPAPHPVGVAAPVRPGSPRRRRGGGGR